MDSLTANQRYHLILADIAMAAAIRTYDSGFDLRPCITNYAPGTIRDSWLAQAADPALRRQVTALANAATGSLQSHTAEDLADIARGYGIPMPDDTADMIADHFTGRREAVMRYNR